VSVVRAYTMREPAILPVITLSTITALELSRGTLPTGASR
jgi:hypothetical protein